MASSGTGVSLDEAGIISTVLEGILYVFSLCMFGATIWALFQRRTRKTVNYKMLLVAIFLLIFSTVHIVVDILRVLDGLVKFRDTFPGGPPAFFSDVAQYTFVSKNAVYTLQTLLGDAVVIYRCYVVWRSVWIVILPMMMWCAVAATGVGTIYTQSTTSADDIYLKWTGWWITAFFALTLSTNLLATVLLAYRIWSINRNISSGRVGGRQLLPTLLIIVDAAALYSVTLFTALICFVCKSNGQFVVLDMLTPIISIAFYMVIIRVGMRQTVTVEPSGHRISAPQTPLSIQGVQSQQSFRMMPVQVHMTRVTDSDNFGPLDKDYNDSMSGSNRVEAV